MAIKKLQQHFTTPEQSKRLLELGVPRWNADEYRDEKGYRHSLEGVMDVELYFYHFPNSIPCWSVGRLMEIYEICASEYMDGIKIPRNHIILDKVLIEFFGVLQHGDMDFSKLEE